MLKHREGKNVPDVIFKTLSNDKSVDITTDELFKGKTVVVFSLPGAFTKTCSKAHLPGYEELAGAFKENGVDDIICISVNDAYVMNAWKKDRGVKNVRLIPDGNGDFTKGMGMLVDKTANGYGMRSWRYSMLVKDTVIERQFIEAEAPAGSFKVSDADTMLEYINPKVK